MRTKTKFFDFSVAIFTLTDEELNSFDCWNINPFTASLANSAIFLESMLIYNAPKCETMSSYIWIEKGQYSDLMFEVSYWEVTSSGYRLNRITVQEAIDTFKYTSIRQAPY